MQLAKIIKFSYVVNIVWVLVITMGCGFHLRGSFTFPSHLKTISITPDDPYDPLQKNIRRSLKQNNVQIITQPSFPLHEGNNKKFAVLTLTQSQFTEDVLAFAPSGQAQRFKLTLTCQYKLDYGKVSLRPLTTIQVSRDFTATPNAILSSSNERRLIREELLQEITQKLLQQLSVSTLPGT